jgi:serine/threonine protein phosphatase PrpC
MARSANPVEKVVQPKKAKSSKVAKASKASSPLTFARSSVAHAYHPERNEDFVIADVKTGLAAVFDGVGSTAGAVASRVASEVIHREWKKQLREAHSCREIDIRASLKSMIEEANDSLKPGEKRDSRAAQAGQGTDTTVVLAVFCAAEGANEQVYRMTYAHVGDSRIYLLPRGERLKRLTEDDGYFSLLLQDQLISQDDALRIDQAAYADDLTDLEQEYFDRRNGITQALGDVEPLEIHVGEVDLHPGDRVLLCSDGIHDNLLDSEIEDYLMNAARTTAARVLVNAAIRRSKEEDETMIRPKADDMSALVVTYREG